MIIKHLANQNDQLLVMATLAADDFEVVEFKNFEYLQRIKRFDQARQPSQDVFGN